MERVPNRVLRFDVTHMCMVLCAPDFAASHSTLCVTIPKGLRLQNTLELSTEGVLGCGGCWNLSFCVPGFCMCDSAEHTRMQSDIGPDVSKGGHNVWEVEAGSTAR